MILSNKKGFRWYSTSQCHVKGYVFDSEGRYFEKEGLLECFDGVTTSFELEKILSRFSGCFSVIISSGQEILISGDIIRSLPLFYKKGKVGWIISDEADRVINDGESVLLNPMAMLEFKGTGYVTGSDTLIEGLHQIQAGEIVQLDSGIRRKFYYSYRLHMPAGGSYAELRQRGREVMESAFGRLVKSLNGRTAVVPLSGGFDSRLIAVMLKNYGYENVVCFTYGRKGNPEAQLSKKVAEKLNFRWYFIEYSEELIKDFVSDEEFRSYYRWAANYVSMFFMQEYFAVRFLKDQQLIPEDAVFISGHSGDFLGGSQFAKHQISTLDEPISAVVDRIFRVKYHFVKYRGNEKVLIKDRIARKIEEKGRFSEGLTYSIHEDYDFKEKLAKFNVNSVSTYTFFGYEFRLPYWDKDMVEFFRELPVSAKVGKQLYDDILVNDFFVFHGLEFNKELQADERVYARSRIKKRIKAFLPEVLIRLFIKKRDILCYMEITSLLKKDMLKKGKRPGNHGNKYNKVLIEWYLETLKEVLAENIH